MIGRFPSELENLLSVVGLVCAATNERLRRMKEVCTFVITLHHRPPISPFALHGLQTRYGAGWGRLEQDFAVVHVSFLSLSRPPSSISRLVFGINGAAVRWILFSRSPHPVVLTMDHGKIPP